ncbi:hypothetical protein Nepgr_024784 [Nepenthes gracilis]|uniref:Uncharacterized protein n=1 Tax=Nepenthes gracilis TaxID=150966 RepID=A0AAD3T6K1_NEPGR|nr:hypothetical protein Nepgr_024784 [Nepenthes gracilis]
MNRLYHARICIEVRRDDPLPEKNWLLTGAVDFAKIVEVQIVYHSEPSHHISQHLNSQKRGSRSLHQQPNCPQAPAHEPGSHVGLVVQPSDLMLDAEALKESSSAHVIPSSSGMGCVLCSTATDSVSEPAEAEVGLKGTQVEDGGASHYPVDDGGSSYRALVDPGGTHQNLVYPTCDLDQLESNVPPVSLADSLNCGLGIPPPATDEFPKVDSVDQSSDASPFIALDQAPFLKVVRFAPEILSAEASSCAPHRRIPHLEVHVESGCQVTMPPIDVYGNSGKFSCSVAEEALPQPESLPTPIAVLNAEPPAGAVIETPALPFDDSRALTRPNSPLPDPNVLGGLLVLLGHNKSCSPGIFICLHWSELLDAAALFCCGPVPDWDAVLDCCLLHQWARSCLDVAISGLGGLTLLELSWASLVLELTMRHKCRCWQHNDSLLKGVVELLKLLLKPSRLQILVAAIRITTLWLQHDAEELTAVGVRLLASLLVFCIWCGRSGACAVPYFALC